MCIHCTALSLVGITLDESQSSSRSPLALVATITTIVDNIVRVVSRRFGYEVEHIYGTQSESNVSYHAAWSSVRTSTMRTLVQQRVRRSVDYRTSRVQVTDFRCHLVVLRIAFSVVLDYKMTIVARGELARCSLV
ncbi:hypothetical protein Tco_0871062 [Tanacetum coccineum]